MLYPQINSYRSVFDLSGFWEFKPDPQDIGEKKQWFKSVSVTQIIAIPASWNELYPDFELKNRVETVWYFFKTFIPQDWSDKNIWLRVGSANYLTKVWWNGTPLGQHEGGYLPFEFLVRPALLLEKENLIAIRVNRTLSSTTIPPIFAPGKRAFSGAPGFPDANFDFFPYGGIHRPVKLYSTSKSYIKDMTLHTSIAGKKGVVDFEIEIESTRPLNVQANITDRPETSQTMAFSKGRPVCGRLEIADCQFWSPQNPHLYTLRVSLYRDKEIVDTYDLPFGVRTVSLKGNQFLLNGKPVYFKGFGKHEDFPVLGKGLNHAVLIKDFYLLKWLNANSFRTTHYPYSEETLQLADRMGILVIDESAAVGLAFHYPDIGEMLATHKNELTALYKRDKNHPSVVMWSVANEPESWHKKSAPYFKDIASFMRKLDSSRPITLVTCTDNAKNEFCADFFDVISLNKYFGWYTEFGQLDIAEKNLSDHLDSFYRRFKKPVLLTEFGTDTIAGFHEEPSQMFTEEYQTDFIEMYIRVLRSKKYVIGEHIWNFADFQTSQTPLRVQGNKKGLFTRERKPKMAARKLREIWTQDNR